MTQNARQASPPSADALRRRVRRITASCVGAASLAAAALTVNLAWAADDPAAAGSTATNGGPAAATPSSDSPNSITRAPSSQQSVPPRTLPTPTAPSDGSDGLVAPQQAPLLGNGRSHAQAGGS